MSSEKKMKAPYPRIPRLTGGRAGAVTAAAAGAAADEPVLLAWVEERLGILSSRLDRLATFRCSLCVDLNPPFSDTCGHTDV